MGKNLCIASGEIAAETLRKQGKAHVFAFNEAMCEGETSTDILSDAFIVQRVKAYGIKRCAYTPFYETLNTLLEDVGQVDLYFDEDMFCVINTITLLAYLEVIQYKQKIDFHLIAADGSTVILKSFPIELGQFKKVYQKVLVEKKMMHTGINHLDTGILLYLEYKSPNNQMVQYIKKHEDISREVLCTQMMKQFSMYGIGNVFTLQLIDQCRK